VGNVVRLMPLLLRLSLMSFVSKLKEAKAKEWEMRGKWLEEQLLRAQEQCERDEKAMDERQLEVCETRVSFADH